MSAALVIHHAVRMPHIILSSVACLALTYFYTLSHKRHDCRGKKLLNTKCAFWFFLQIMPETFFFLRRIKRNTVMNVQTWSCKVPDMIWYMIWYIWYMIRYMIWYDIWYDIYNCNWVDTRWQQYSTHLHTNNTQNTGNGTYIITTKLNIQNNKKLTNLGSAGRAPSLRVIPHPQGLQSGQLQICKKDSQSVETVTEQERQL
jgi:hypothetical protein